MSKQNRRRTKIVNSSVQKRLILSVATLPAIGLGIMVSIVCLFCVRLYEESLHMQGGLKSLMPLFLSVSGVSFFTVVVLVASAYKLSHKIAGPMHRICKSLEQIREGDVAFKVGLRDGDHLTDIATELNKLLDQLNENPPPGYTTREMRARQETGAAPAEATTEVDAPLETAEA